MDIVSILVVTFIVFLGIVFGAIVSLGILILVGPLIPGLVASLSNKPNLNRGEAKTTDEYEVSEFGFFTSLSPGQVKIITADNKFVRCVMDYPGHTFRGLTDKDLNKERPEYWEVIETPPGHEDAHPVTPALFYWWRKWVHGLTGFVFIGVYPFRSIHTYRLERFRKDRKTGELDRTEDYSDHYRVADFNFPVIVPEADTQDKVTVSIALDNILRIRNPFQTAYATTDWAGRVTSAVSDKVTGYTRAHPLDEILSSKEGDDENKMADAIKTIGEEIEGKNVSPGETITTFGVFMIQVLVVDIKPPEDAAGRLADLAYARIERAAQAERAKGEAAMLQEQIMVVEKSGHYGLAVLASERSIKTASAAGKGGIVVVGGESNTDPIQAAILKELRDQSLRNQLEGKE